MTRRGGISLVGALLALALITTPAAARDELVDGSVTPRNGTTSTVFAFTVTYQGTYPAAGVSAELTPGGPIIDLKPLGLPTDGQWTAARTLPTGSFAVTFVARASNRRTLATLPLPYRVIVSGLPTPSPSPSARPTPSPSPAPTPTHFAPTPISGESATAIGSPSASEGGALQTPVAVGGAVGEEPSASGAQAGSAPASAADGGALAVYLLAGVLAIGVLAGIAGLAAGSSANALGRRGAPRSIGPSPAPPAEAWDAQATDVEEVTGDGDQAPR